MRPHHMQVSESMVLSARDERGPFFIGKQYYNADCGYWIHYARFSVEFWATRAEAYMAWASGAYTMTFVKF